jgi:sigma-54 dependent transcriptional regulator of gfr operon
MTIRDTVYNKLKEKTYSLDWNDLEGFSASVIASMMDMNRSSASEYLNELVDTGKVIKINSRPVLFFAREALLSDYSERLKTQYNSNAELRKDLQELSKKSKAFLNFIGYRGSLRNIIDQIKSAVTYPDGGLPVLLLGPTGVGKSLIAKMMFEYAKEKGVFGQDAEFLVVNCSEYADNPELFLTNIFGNVKGAYTGADRNRNGLLQIANGGMLFFDEVHCLKPECQEKLYLFMDQGIYHMVGDNEKWFESKVLFVFATTEEPKTALLKPLLRRIPVLCRIPTLSQRPRQERKEMLCLFLELESARIHKNIKISRQIADFLVDYDFGGNIGDFQNCIRVSIAKALINVKPEQKDVTLSFRYLPDDLINDVAESSHIDHLFEDIDTLDINELKQQNYQDQPFYRFNHKLLSLYENHTDFENLFKQVNEAVSQYLDTLSYESNDYAVNDVLYRGFFENIRNKFSSRSAMKFSNIQIISLAKLLGDFLHEYPSAFRFIENNRNIIRAFVNYIDENDHSYYGLCLQALEILGNYLNTDFGTLGKLNFYYFFKVMDTNTSEAVLRVIILAHGYSTASSMATAANSMLQARIFGSIDMPIDVHMVQIAQKVNEYIADTESTSDLLFLVDMGSLEEIHNSIYFSEKISVGVINNVTMKLILDIGVMVLNGKTVREIINDITIKDYYHKSVLIESKKRPEAVLTVCATGFATAEKIADLLIQSLPRKVNCEILPWSFEELSEQKNQASVFKQYNIMYIVGLSNPQIESVPFIPLEELVEKQNIEKVKMLVQKEFNEKEIEQFGNNILRNFSLQNLIQYLTILNPEKIVAFAEDIITDIQKNVPYRLSSITVVGLYIHISCLIERLIMDNYITQYHNLEEFMKQNEDFIRTMKRCFMKLEKHYCVDIPISELAYLYDYIFRPQQASVGFNIDTIQ